MKGEQERESKSQAEQKSVCALAMRLALDTRGYAFGTGGSRTDGMLSAIKREEQTCRREDERTVGWRWGL